MSGEEHDSEQRGGGGGGGGGGVVPWVPLVSFFGFDSVSPCFWQLMKRKPWFQSALLPSICLRVVCGSYRRRGVVHDMAAGH